MIELPPDVREGMYESGVKGFRLWLIDNYQTDPFTCYSRVSRLMMAELVDKGISVESIEALSYAFTEGWSHAHDTFEKMVRDGDWIEWMIDIPFDPLWTAYLHWCKHMDIELEPKNTVYVLYETFKKGAPECAGMN